MAQIDLVDVSKHYGPRVAVDRVSLTIPDGSFTVLLGPSGSGKTTCLLMIAGLEEMTSGQILFDGSSVNHIPTRRRDVAMVFQNYALYPHMSVFDNLAFGLRRRHYSRDEVNRRVMNAAEALGLEPELRRRPAQLSGGQRQRVALGRAIVRQPRAFLMDEPLSNLDARLRAQMRLELRELHQRTHGTFVYVTHDQTEAMVLGDVVAVFDLGHIKQVGPPEEIFSKPANSFVAAFVGSPEMNLIPGQLHRVGDDAVFQGPFKLVAPAPAWLKRDMHVVLGIRPHELIAFPPSSESDRLPVRVLLEEPLGGDVFLMTEAGVRLAARSDRAARQVIGSTVHLDFGQVHGHVFGDGGERLGSLLGLSPTVLDKVVDANAAHKKA